MNLSEEAKAYLAKRTKEALDFISRIPLPNEVDAYRINSAISRAVVEAPYLNLRERTPKHVQEVPDYSLISNMPMQQGRPYNGISVKIPVKGNWELFIAYIGKRWICNGFKFGDGSISITQYDFNDNNLDLVKDHIKAGVESLEGLLNELTEAVDKHNDSLTNEVNTAAEARKREILASWQKDKDADPWG